MGLKPQVDTTEKEALITFGKKATGFKLFEFPQADDALEGRGLGGGKVGEVGDRSKAYSVKASRSCTGDGGDGGGYVVGGGAAAEEKPARVDVEEGNDNANDGKNDDGG